ncbi:MAG TPA: patatin-like phospholipase family protein [Jatrophihabitans sp.]|jgi:NTE family protein|uniref:patatin-like phospholipase family protein n=1 Tax=Jatrophihabitans sp. TaxID=1932789 RepID=UPI002DF96852|nr:patatin-like phospholipase family protein [Jatrophihabitans sp.]
MVKAAPRRGLVLGAGGALGGAWMVGALQALADEEGFEPRSVDVVLGTSAGSVVAGLLGCGVPVADLAHRLDTSDEPHVEGTGPVNPFDVHEALATVPRPVLLPGNLRLAARTIWRPHRHTLLTMAAGLAPRGRGDLGVLAELIAEANADGPGWPRRPQTWIAAMDFDSGRRVIFGRDGTAEVPLPDAVIASCAAPGFFPPVRIGGHRYVDGGAVSMTNADVLVGTPVDDVLVLAPMATYEPTRRWSAVGQAELGLRRRVTHRLDIEVARLVAAGVRVRVLTPTATDLEVMGLNVMNPARRREVFTTALSTTPEQLDRQHSLR